MAHRLYQEAYPCSDDSPRVQLLSDQLEKLKALQKYYENNHLFELLTKTNTQIHNITEERKKLVHKKEVPYLDKYSYKYTTYRFDDRARKCAWIKKK